MPHWISVQPLADGGVSEVAEEVIALGNETSVDGIAYSCSLCPEGNPAADKAALYASRYSEVASLVLARSAVKQGILLQSTMGHGWRPGEETPWQQAITGKGERVYRFCPLDPDFLAYVGKACRTLDGVRPDFFMVDDDTRLVWEHPGCFCPLHLAAFGRLTGRAWTRGQVVTMLSSGDVTLKEKWLQLKTDSLAGFFRTIRAGFGANVPGLLCTARYGEHLRHARAFASILAAPGQTPVVRISGAPYHSRDLYTILIDKTSAAVQRQQIGDGVLFLQEGDTCPQTRWATSATRLFNYLTILSLDGVRGAKLWLTRIGNPHEKRAARAYRSILRENRGILDWTANVEFRPTGVVIPVCGPPSWNWGDQYFGLMGIPYRFGTARPGEVTALTETAVERMSDEAIREVLAGRVLLDGSAIIWLASHGYAADVGIRAKAWRGKTVRQEAFLDGTRFKGRLSAGSADLTDLLPGAEVLSRLYNCPSLGANPVEVAPGSVLFANARGGLVLTLAQRLPEQQPHHGQAMMQCETYKDRVVNHLIRLGDGIPGGAYYRGDVPLLCETGTTAEGEKILVLDNLQLDVEFAPEVVFTRMPRRIERLQGDGSWTFVQFEADNDGVAVLRTRLEPQRPAIFRVSDEEMMEQGRRK